MSDRVYRAALVALLLATAVGGVFLAVRAAAPRGVEVALPTPTSTPELKVYVSGAVRSPGVYSLQPDERWEQAVKAAGGPVPGADISRVNLARRARDQDQVHVPWLGETSSPVTVGAPTLLNLNAAPAEALATLPGIGPVKAEAIVAYRDEQGPFQRVDQLMQVPGIGPITYEALRNLVTVD